MNRFIAAIVGGVLVVSAVLGACSGDDDGAGGSGAFGGSGASGGPGGAGGTGGGGTGGVGGTGGAGGAGGVGGVGGTGGSGGEPVVPVVKVTCPGTPDANVITDNFAFVPKSTTISVGQVVEIETEAIHNVDGDDPALNVGFGGDACFRFDVPGTYGFHCMPHKFTGSVVVK